jgi:hypothetical protein
MGGAVLLPEQPERDALAAQLPVNDRPVGQRPGHRGASGFLKSRRSRAA